MVRVSHGAYGLLLALACSVEGLAGCTAQQPVQAVPVTAASVRVQVRLRCEGPCGAIQRSCDTACDHLGYDPTPGHDSQHCRDECSDNYGDCLQDCAGH